MTFSSLVNRAQKFAVDNSTGILTAVGVTGTITTAYLTGKATFKAAEIIREEEDSVWSETRLPHTPLEPKEKFKLVWKLYIPPAVTGLLTVSSIISANQIGTRRAAAVAAAYSISEKGWQEYKEKVVEKFGENKERAVRDELAQDRIDRNPLGEREVIMVSTGDVMCYEAFTGRYFKSDVESLKKAQNDTNHQILSNSYASLTDFYNHVGLPKTAVSDEIGWNTDRLLELEFSTTLSDDGKPCISIDYQVGPVRDYFRFH